MKILAVVGARPNFMKIAPIMWASNQRSGLETYLVHTGQHYDDRMSELFFQDLKIPRPNINMGVGSASHAVQTAEIMKRFEPIVTEQIPDLVLVVGDVNSTLACTLTAVKMGVRVAHVEAGLRSFDRTMPEEINRIVTDSLSHWLFTTEESGVLNLMREGVSKDRVFLVGNTMIDTLLACRERSEASGILSQFGIANKEYALLTLHRPSNVDNPAIFKGLLKAIDELQRDIPIVFPVHPRTRRVVTEAGLAKLPNVQLVEPLGYLDFMKLMSHARLVLTDSGGIQEETTVLGTPCLTIRENTERPVTVSEGTNQLVGIDPNRIIQAARQVLSRERPSSRIPKYWDGKAAERILDILSADRFPATSVS